ncbi:MAG: phosphodiester glycosidase family protein [Armatimonadota bacterium]
MTNRMRTRTAYILMAALGTAARAWAPEALHYERIVGAGVTFKQDLYPIDHPNGPLAVHTFDVATQTPGVRISAALAGDTVWDTDPTFGREVVSKLAARRKALAAVNAGFFPFAGNPIGLHMEDGNLITEPTKNRSSFLRLKNGLYAIAAYTFKGKITIGTQSLPLSGLNRKPDAMAENIAYTSQFGTQTLKLENRYWLLLDVPDGSLHVGSLTASVTITDNIPQIELSPTRIAIAVSQQAYDLLRPVITDGAMATVTCELVPIDADAPQGVDITDAVTGAPRILTNGKVDVRYKQEKMSESFSSVRHPRTAVGIRPDGSVILVTVDGRQAELSRGATLPELAGILIANGATQGLNLDGGGSSVAVARNLVVNSPSDGSQRPVADALLVTGELPMGLPDTFSITGIPVNQAMIGDSQDLKDSSGRPVETGIWGTDGKGVFVDQGGRLRILRAGTSKVSIAYPGSQASSVIKALDPNPPAKPKQPPGR